MTRPTATKSPLDRLVAVAHDPAEARGLLAAYTNAEMIEAKREYVERVESLVALGDACGLLSRLPLKKPPVPFVARGDVLWDHLNDHVSQGVLSDGRTANVVGPPFGDGWSAAIADDGSVERVADGSGAPIRFASREAACAAIESIAP